jgi:cell pole-organizing protein PopZ
MLLRRMGDQGNVMGDMSREPSMEEILSSIRRVIARDEAQINGGRSAPAPVVAQAADDDVLELTEAAAALTDAVAAKTPPIAPADAATAEPAPPETEVAPVFIRAPAVVEEATLADPILSPAPQAAARQQLDTLTAALAAAQHSEPRPADSATTVNALVEASLRPMLRDWLDANLPDIVERIVAREIARISGTGV